MNNYSPEQTDSDSRKVVEDAAADCDSIVADVVSWPPARFEVGVLTAKVPGSDVVAAA